MIYMKSQLKRTISNLGFKAVKGALIKVPLPCFQTQSLIKGMGLFWKQLSPAILDSLFDCTIPLPEMVIEHLEPKLGCQKGQSVFTCCIGIISGAARKPNCKSL